MYLPGGVAALGAVVRDPVGALAQGDQGEQTPQAVPVADVQVPLPVAEEEALVRRLDDVLGIDFVAQGGVELAPGQGDQLLGEAAEQLASSIVVPGPQPVHPLRERIVHDRSRRAGSLEFLLTAAGGREGLPECRRGAAPHAIAVLWRIVATELSPGAA